MTLQEQINTDLQTYIKTKDPRKNMLKIIVGDIQRIVAKVVEDADVLQILKSNKKAIEEKIELGVNNTDDDILISMIISYLPKEVTEEEITSWIKENINFGEFANKMQAMRPIMAHFEGRANGKLVREIIERHE
ncbi:MAG: GatB/YqeY domain-containing protein [Candidatus Peribacteraceae bacterium]|nr:GatB/YqeY domain-containing protein [Candidatus Peribacteraceae bacterium]